MTKKERELFNKYYDAFKKGAKTELWQVYKTCSVEKQKALARCKMLQLRLGGYHATIVTSNPYQFTYAFLYWDADTKKECLCYCTASNDYKFPLE